MANTVHIIDVTNRDGVQTSRILLPKLSKTMLNIYLDQMGIFQSEVGFPTLKHEVGYINANLKLFEKGIMKQIHLEGWCRAVVEDIETTFKNCPKMRHLNISASTSDILIQGKYQGRKTFKDVIDGMVRALRAAKDAGADTVGVNAEDASRTDLDKLEEFIIAGKENGASRFRYCDTLGSEDPISMYEKIKSLSEKTKFPIEMHCHNDLGMAEAISIAGARGAIECGIDTYINTTVNGYGERAGNADLVSILLALKFSPYFIKKGITSDNVDLKKSWRIARYASYAFGLPIAINQPGVGANAFAHESGIHADGTLKDRRNYELYDYEEVGRGEPDLLQTGRVITTGAYGGITGFRHVYDGLGVHFNSDYEAREILELVQYANLHTQKPLTDDELRLLASHPDEARELLRISL
ncbi:MAG: homocitrate synthase [Nitrospirae bacterium]|nr:homocitrate synthase [Nitrospirota bacterium]